MSVDIEVPDEIRALLADVYRPRGVETWWRAPNRNLHGARPQGLWRTGVVAVRRIVLAEAQRLADGVTVTRLDDIYDEIHAERVHARGIVTPGQRDWLAALGGHGRLWRPSDMAAIAAELRHGPEAAA